MRLSLINENIDASMLQNVSLDMPTEVMADMLEDSGGTIDAAIDILERIQGLAAVWMRDEYNIWCDYYEKAESVMGDSGVWYACERFWPELGLIFYPSSTVLKQDPRARGNYAWLMAFRRSPDKCLQQQVGLLRSDRSYTASSIPRRLDRVLKSINNKMKILANVYQGFLDHVVPRIIKR